MFSGKSRYSGRKSLIAGVGVLMGVLAAGGLAWACTVAPPVVVLAPRWGPAGTAVALTGTRFNPAVPVQIHWNSAEGPLLGTASGADFSTSVTIPAHLARTVGYVVATQPGPNGTLAARIPAAFEVTDSSGGAGSASSLGTGDLWSGLSASNPAPADRLAGAPSSSETPLMLLAGLGLAALGAAAGVSALVFAAARRTKREATPRRSR